MTFDRVILDADSLLYRCGFAATGEPLSHSLHNLKNQINSISDELEVPVSNFEIYIKGKGNFREKIAVSTVYKGTRSRRLPEFYDEMYEYIINVFGARPVDGMEADDMCSVRLYDAFKKSENVILAAIDKDLWNTPGWHFNYHPDKWRKEYVSPGQADRNFLRQLVSGDRSDNVPGLGKIPTKYRELYKWSHKKAGDAFANIVVSDGVSNKTAYSTIFDMYLEMGKEAGMDTTESIDYFKEQARLLWMTRELNEAGIPVLWELPKEFEIH